MATIRKQGNSWRADVKKNGVRKSASFPTKAAAKEWALKIETEMLSKRLGHIQKHTFAEALDRYALDISSKKKSCAKEVLRINAFKRDFPEITEKLITNVSAPDMAMWRDKRAQDVSNGTILREMNILKNVFTIARKEWNWCHESPFDGVKRPPAPAPRERRISPKEVKRICRQLGYVTGRIETKSQEVALVFLIALRTGMRSGEILDLNEDRINFKDRVLIVPHKTQHITGRERKIPITRHTVRLLGYLEKRGYYFTVDDKSRDTLFRKAKKIQGIKDLHFHDSRAEALTRLAKKVDVMTLAKISGHKDLKILFNTYYRETAEDIAKRL